MPNIPSSWHSAYTLARSARDPYGNGKPIANNTRLILYTSDDVGMVFHKTVIVTYLTDGGMMLNSGGWRTVTTKNRIDQALPTGWALRSEQGQWFVTYLPTGMEFIFYDGFEFVPDGFGQLVPKPDNNKVKAELSAWEYNKAIKGQIQRFIRNLTAEQVSNALEGHSPCEQCMVRPSQDYPDHLAVHVQENYLTAGLIHNALMTRGFVDPILIRNVILITAKEQDEVDTILKQALRKYLYRQIMGV